MTLPPGAISDPGKQRKRAKLILTLGYSVQASNTTRRFVVVIAGARDDCPTDVLDAFDKAGFGVDVVPHVEPPKWARKRFQYSFSKMNARGLTQYDKVTRHERPLTQMHRLPAWIRILRAIGILRSKLCVEATGASSGRPEDVQKCRVSSFVQFFFFVL
jgi:hypothetical protein